MAPNPQDPSLAAFLPVRPRIFGLAYRMLGSASEAEDLVQEVWLRWQAVDHSLVVDPPAFLITTATRLALTATQSARARRETYIGPWLPEPVDTSANAALGAERAQALEFAVLILLEKLNPQERAAYILREAFDYPYRRIAEILEIQEPYTRQLVTRARRHLTEQRQAPVPPAEQRRLLAAFLAAAQQGDLASLESLLTAEAVSLSDGGGTVRAATVPLLGRRRIAKFAGGIAGRFWSGATLSWREANGQPVAVVSRDGVVIVMVAIDASAEGIQQLFWIRNPAKLTAWPEPR